MKKYIKGNTDLAFIMLFVVLAMCLLAQNTDMLYMAQQHSLFLKGSAYWHECMRQAGGLLMWIGLAGTSVLAIPAMGITLLITIWLISYWLLRLVFPLPQTWRWMLLLPLFAMLASIVDVGYWVYYMKQPGYWYRESIGLVFVLLLLLTDQKGKGWMATLLTIICYPLIGWYSTLTFILLCVRQILRREIKTTIFSIVSLLIVPAIVCKCYTTLRPNDAWWIHFPLVANYETVAWSMLWPFIALIAILLILCFISHHQPQKGKWTIAIAGICVSIVATWAANYNNANFHAENRMYHAAKEFRWNIVLNEMEQAKDGPTRQMVCCKNLALLHTGTLSQIFNYENNGPSPAVRDSLPLHMAQSAAPLLYLYHGMTNDAIHWAIENSVEYGLNLDNLQIMALSAIINGESKLADKYLNMLSLAPFQTSFVKRYYPLVNNPDWIDEYPELKLIAELHSELLEVPYHDDGNCEWRIYKNFAQVLGFKSRKAQELALVYAMMLKDYTLFWPQLFDYAKQMHTGEMPKSIQEAAYLGCQLNPEKYPEDKFRFDKTLANRYKNLRIKRSPTNDHSYWWFYFYCTDAHTY